MLKEEEKETLFVKHKFAESAFRNDDNLKNKKDS